MASVVYEVDVAEEAAPEVDGHVEFTLTLDHLRAVPEPGGQTIRPLHGSTTSSPYPIFAVDADGIVSSRWGDSHARPNMLGRLVRIRRQVDGGPWEHVDTGRCSDFGETDGPGLYRFDVTDERWTERRANIFGHTRSIQVHPYGITERWRDVLPAGRDDWLVGQVEGDAVYLVPQGQPVELPSVVAEIAASDVVPPNEIDISPENTEGNFHNLCFEVSGVERPIIAFTATITIGANTQGNVLGSLAPPTPGSDGNIIRAGAMWVHWPDHGLSVDQYVDDGRLWFGGAGIPTSDALPLLIGGQDGVHLGRLIVDILEGEYGGSATRLSPTHREAIISADLPRVWLRQTEEAPRGRWLEENVYRLFQVIPFADSAAGVKLLQMWAPQDIDPDTLPLLDADTVSSGYTWQNMGREVANRLVVDWPRPVTWRLQDEGERPVDSLKILRNPVEVTADTTDTLGDKPLTITTDVIVDIDQRHDLTGWLAAEAFGIWADGPIVRRLRAENVTLDLTPGDLARIDCESLQIGNPATSDRAGQRIARVLEAKVGPVSSELVLLDFGPALQPLEPPTFSVEQASGTKYRAHISDLPSGARATVEMAVTKSADLPEEDEWQYRRSGLEEGAHDFLILRSGTHLHGRAHSYV